jgi:hypothetical protein
MYVSHRLLYNSPSNFKSNGTLAATRLINFGSGDEAFAAIGVDKQNHTCRKPEVDLLIAGTSPPTGSSHLTAPLQD